ARFDPRKAEAINAAHIRLVTPEQFAARFVAYAHEVEASADTAVLSRAAPLVQERIQTLGEGLEMLRFLLMAQEDFEVDEIAAAKQLGDEGQAVLAASYPVLEQLGEWNAATLEPALHEALVVGLGLKPRHAYGPLRVAVTGRTVSPPLFESMELLGRERSLARLQAARS
ncbi:MAG: glutamate--tRNA ligase, partial [Pseudonocardiales bacterium]